MKILVADDDCRLNRLICDALVEAKFEPDPALTAKEAQSKIRRNNYSLALIDWMFDGEDVNGVDLIHAVKSKQKTFPTMLLTGRSALADRVAGLESGADDYLIKPFYLPEMVARVKALLRRSRWVVEKSPPGKRKVGIFELTPSKWEVAIAGEKIKLTKKEFLILDFLLKNRGRVVPKNKLSAQVWGHTDFLNSNTIEVHLRHLRSALGDHGKLVETVRGQGYLVN